MVSAVFNPYKILGVNEDASRDEIKAAFRKKSKECHPDQNGESSQDFLNIKKAYDILMNEEKREGFNTYGIVIDFKEESRKLAFTVFLEVVSQCAKEDFLDAEINDFVEIGLLPKFEAELKFIEEKIINLQTRLKRIVKKPDDDFVTERGEKVLAEYDREYKMVLLKVDLHKAALALLKEYKFDFDRIGAYGEGASADMTVIDTLTHFLDGSAKKNAYNPENTVLNGGGKKKRKGGAGA